MRKLAEVHVHHLHDRELPVKHHNTQSYWQEVVSACVLWWQRQFHCSLCSLTSCVVECAYVCGAFTNCMYLCKLVHLAREWRPPIWYNAGWLWPLSHWIAQTSECVVVSWLGSCFAGRWGQVWLHKHCWLVEVVDLAWPRELRLQSYLLWWEAK